MKVLIDDNGKTYEYFEKKDLKISGKVATFKIPKLPGYFSAQLAWPENLKSFAICLQCKKQITVPKKSEGVVFSTGKHLETTEEIFAFPIWEDGKFEGWICKPCMSKLAPHVNELKIWIDAFDYGPELTYIG